MKLSTILYSVALISSQAAAHPHHDVSPALAKRHSNLSKRCAAGAASLNEKRYQRRNKMKRDLEQRSGNATYEITTEAPYYQVIQNDTCVLTPDVTAGPYYWPRSETLRQDMSENQLGVPLLMDIGVLDMNTCEPLPNALVVFWHCNATGSYSSFTGRDPNTGFPDLLNELNITDFAIGETDLHTDDTTWLRGMWPTNEDGMMEMKTVFPGFYIERTIHVHAQGMAKFRQTLDSKSDLDQSTLTGYFTPTAQSLPEMPSLQASCTLVKPFPSNSWPWSPIPVTRRLTEPLMMLIPSFLAAPMEVIIPSSTSSRRMERMSRMA